MTAPCRKSFPPGSQRALRHRPERMCWVSAPCPRAGAVPGRTATVGRCSLNFPAHTSWGARRAPIWGACIFFPLQSSCQRCPDAERRDGWMDVAGLSDAHGIMGRAPSALISSLASVLTATAADSALAKQRLHLDHLPGLLPSLTKPLPQLLCSLVSSL